MENITLNIGKEVTLITKSFVRSEKMGNFAELISSLNNISLVGLSKPNKMNKYMNLLIENGFVLTETLYCNNAGFEGKNSDVLNYRYNYTKK